ncbi:hypothetical protein ERD95_21925 [Enterobacteriaceae bacterium ML5]|nr:hypothetical protein ERD95_21925 [Enterobacteriaceae bacterium ML5]
MGIVKAALFVLCLMLFGLGMTYTDYEPGYGLMRSVGFGGLGLAVIIAWIEVKGALKKMAR